MSNNIEQFPDRLSEIAKEKADKKQALEMGVRVADILREYDIDITLKLKTLQGVSNAARVSEMLKAIFGSKEGE